MHPGMDGAADLVGREEPARAREWPHDRADQRGGTAGLVQQRMRRLVQDDLVARAAVHREGDLVAHRPARQEERGLLAQQSGDHVLQAIDRRVFPLLLVAHLRLGHGLAHGGVGRVTVSL